MIRSAYGFSTLVNLKFGKLTVLNDGYIKNKNRIVPIKCECGTEKKVYFQNLAKGVTTSCGCVAREQAKNRLIQNPISRNLLSGEAAKNALLCVYKGKARERGLIWNIADNHFFQLTATNCFYCDKPPNNIKKTQYKTGEYLYNGIDRVDNTIGYIPDNIVPCCKICNIAKNEMTINEFKGWIIRLYNKMVNQ